MNFSYQFKRLQNGVVHWLQHSRIIRFLYRLAALLTGLLLYFMLMSFTLILLSLLVIKFCIESLLGQKTMKPDETNEHFVATKIPSLPKW